MTWTDASDNSEQWGDVALKSEHAMLDDSSYELMDESGNVLVWGDVVTWTDEAANSETWT